jgi:lethal(2) giant larvae protein
MFKFAHTINNKLSGGGQNNSSSTGGGVGATSATTSSTGNTQHDLTSSMTTSGSMSSSSSSAANRRRLIQKDLFAYNKIADKGFPSKPAAMDYDRKLRLLAIATKNGDIRVYGGAINTKAQQMSSYQDVHPFPVQRLLFVQGTHQLITVSERVHRNDSSNRTEVQLYVVLWQIPHIKPENDTKASYVVEKINEYQLDSKMVNGTRLSSLALLNDNSHLFFGFETGDVYVFNVQKFKIVPGVINRDYILKNLPSISAEETAGRKPLSQLGAVESICHHPRQLTKLLLAYQRGLWVIFDFIKNNVDQIHQTSQPLESAVFYQSGECVATAHTDGSFVLWDLESSNSNGTGGTVTASSNIMYGPYPCRPVTKCLVKTCRNEQPLVVFSGGCPRANYSDKISISVVQGETGHVCFEFTSKIIEFFTIDKPFTDKPSNTTYDNPQALLVLLEEEFVAIDLVTEGWPQFKLPYLYSVHSSAIICTHYVNSISKQFYDKLKAVGSNLSSSTVDGPTEFYSEREWPITQPTATTTTKTTTAQNNDGNVDLMLTGHEDGSVRFWDVTNMSMTLIYHLKTSIYFQSVSNHLYIMNVHF